VNWPAGRSRESGRVRTNPAGMTHQSSLADEDASAGTRGEPFSWEQEAPAQGNLRPGIIGLAPPGNAPANLTCRFKNDRCADRSVSDVTPWPQPACADFEVNPVSTTAAIMATATSSFSRVRDEENMATRIREGAPGRASTLTTY
jgi:hypothetical protein